MKQHPLKQLFDYSAFLIIGTIVAFLWANVDADSYTSFVDTSLFAVAEHVETGDGEPAHKSVPHTPHTIKQIVNDILMCFFFALAAKEIWESLLPGGHLSTPRKAAMPLVATVGGMIGPALIYYAGCQIWDRPDLVRGWAVPCATAIAFSYLIARFVFGTGHPAIPFLLLVAVADDAGGLVILATVYANDGGNLVLFFACVATAVGLGFVLNRLGVKSFWPYLVVPGLLSWYGFHVGGLHPALALVPVIPTLPHAKRDIGLFREEEADRKDTLNAFEHWWQNPVELILGAFGLVNAGVPLGSVGVPTGLVLAGLLIGKPIGITLFALFGQGCGLKLPKGMIVRDVVVVGTAAGIGFTVALFVTGVAFNEELLTGTARDLMLEAKNAASMGALASFAGMILTVVVARVLRVKKTTI